MAQDQEEYEKYSVATNSFWSNWFIQAGFNWNTWYSGEEHGNDLKTSPFSKFRSNPGIALAVGKWFTPGLGLRTKLQGIWGKSVEDDNNAGNGNKYWILNEQVLFNVSNMLYGYNEDRVFNFIPFIGGGIGRTCTYNYYAMGLSAGVIAQFNLSRKLALNLELGWNRYEGDIDGICYNINEGKRGWDSHDNNVYAEVGLTYNLGTATWRKVPNVDAIRAASQAEIDALNSRLADMQAENNRLRNQKPVVIKDTITQSFKDFITTPVSVFFDLNKTNVANPKDLVNVRALAKYARENNSDILVTGYADSATGTPEINERLSLQRAETVKNELIKMGVASAKIKTTHNGGVNILGQELPKDFDRRATVQIVE